MKVFDLTSFEHAQFASRIAVDIGSDSGGSFDWECAMLSMAVAMGYAEVGAYEAICSSREKMGETYERIPG